MASRIYWNSKFNPDNIYPELMRWVRKTLLVIGIRVEEKGTPYLNEPIIFVSNHVGFLDIGVWVARVPAAFLSKQSIRYWPFIGKAAVMLGVVFMKRQSGHSRAAAIYEVGRAIRENNRSIVIFPEGTSSIEGKTWKWGAFRIAQENKLKIQPTVITFSDMVACSYINKDNFFVKLWDACGNESTVATLEFLDPVEITDFRVQAVAIQNRVHNMQRDFLDNLDESQKLVTTLD